MTIAKTPADVQNAIDVLYGERDAEAAAPAPHPIAAVVASAAQQLQHIHDGDLDNKRLMAAGELVLGNGVTLHLDDTSAVQSGTRVYSQQGGVCSCPDHQKRGSYCKHLMAVDLYRLAQHALRGKPTGEAPASEVLPESSAWGCTEAPVSCYFKMRVGHLEMSYTMRDVNDERMAVRVKAMLPKIQRLMEHEEQRQAERSAEREAARLPQEPLPETHHANGTHAASSADVEPPVCQYHGPMRASTKAPGTWYCPSKMGDGTYCKARWPQS